jgi:hypothetical protein
MKTFLLTTIAFLAFTITCKAQWTPGTGIITTTNNVGIGTTAPNANLETQSTTEQLRLSYDATHFTSFTNSYLGNLTIGQTGNITFVPSQSLTIGSNNNSGLIVDSPTGYGAYTRMRTGTAGSISDFSINAGVGSTNNLRFVNNKSTNTIMTLNSNDFVGIGTIAPAAALDILGASATTGFRSLNSAALGTTSGGGLLAATPAIPTAADQRLGVVGFGGIYYGATYRYPSQISSFSSEAWSSSNAGSYLTFSTSTSGTVSAIERMRIDNTGNVGIGTTTPVNTLHVYDNNTGNNANVGITIEQGGAGNSLLQFLQTGTQRWTVGIDNTNSRSFKIATGQGLGTADKFTILTSGYVGIGTANPDQKLTVVGTIHSTSVLVDTNMPPPDYVFKDGYHLPTLAEVKAYTDKNHHLPEVPAAAEFEKNGINLGEMNMLLLKKVEELTLYLIEKDKQLQEQQKTNDIVKQQVELLKLQQKQIDDLRKTLVKLTAQAAK